MFRGPFPNKPLDEEATAASEENTTTQAVPGEAWSAPSSKTTSTSCPLAPDGSFLQHAAKSTRSSLFLDDLPGQTMTESDIAEAQADVQAAQTPAYEPSRAAHTICPSYSVHLNSFQSPNTTTPRLPSTPNLRASFNPFANAPPVTDPQTTASLPQLPAPPPMMHAEEIETLLAPMKSELQKLKGTSMPPDNGRVKGKSAMQVLKERLLPIGRHITQCTAATEEDRRGRMEIEVSRYVAEHYWPQGLVRVDGLMIMEMCRNNIFLEKVHHEQWLEEEEEEEEEEEASRLRAEEEEDEWRARAEEEEKEEWGLQAEEEEKAWMFESLENGFADEREDEMPGLVDGHMWRSPGEENFRPELLPGKVTSGLETSDTDDMGDVSMADDASWTDWARWPWAKPKGG